MASIKVGGKSTVIIVPPIEGNEDLPGEEQFQIVIRKVNRWKLQDDSVRTILVDGEVVNELDREGLIKAHIQELKNPPDIEIDGGTVRPMVVDDLFVYDELFDIVTFIYSKINDLAAGVTDTKNS